MIPFVGNLAACAALTQGKAKNRMALMLVYVMWSVAARSNKAGWVERVPSRPDPVDFPSGSQDPPFGAGANKERASSFPSAICRGRLRARIRGPQPCTRLPSLPAKRWVWPCRAATT